VRRFTNAHHGKLNEHSDYFPDYQLSATVNALTNENQYNFAITTIT